MALPALFAAPALLKAILAANVVVGGWAVGEVGRRNQQIRSADGGSQVAQAGPGPGTGPAPIPNELRGQTLEDAQNSQFPGEGGGRGVPEVIGGFHPWQGLAGEDFSVMGGRAALGPERPGIGPRVYTEGEQTYLLYAMSTEEMTRVQDRMASVGLLTGTWFPGQIEDRTVAAFEKLLGMSNARGQQWEATLTSIEQDPRMQDILGGQGKQAFVEPTYLAPDYASIAEEVEAVFRRRLGRDPDEQELAQINAEIQGWHREMFDTEVDASRRQHEGRPGIEAEQIDPMARFRQSFEKNWAGELEVVDERAEHGEARQNLESSINTLRQMARGGF